MEEGELDCVEQDEDEDLPEMTDDIFHDLGDPFGRRDRWLWRCCALC